MDFMIGTVDSKRFAQRFAAAFSDSTELENAGGTA